MLPDGNPVVKKEAELPFDPDLFLSRTNGGKRELHSDKHQVIFSHGAAADSIFYIQMGQVRIVATSEQGKEAVVAILGSGDFCGEGWLAGQPRRMATAVAMTDCLIMRWTRPL
jgi:CRP/FNR family transcriptional regulator, cyclic AMP receptor protein